MDEILIIKTAALGDVLRTTSILPGLQARYPGSRITWVTAPGAADLLVSNPRIASVETVDVDSPADVRTLTERLSQRRWRRIVSLDDEVALCRLASALDSDEVSGAYLRDDGERAYTPDVAPWFDMGLLSVHGKREADRLKVANESSQPRIYASMLGISMGKPQLALPHAARERARRFAHDRGIHDAGGTGRAGPLIGLNTGAGGRWVSKQLSVERTVELASALDRTRGGAIAFLILGGASERERNVEIVRGLTSAGIGARAFDAGSDNSLLDFAAMVSLCDLVVSSDSLCLHIAVALDVPVVAFFAPTSAAEIELYGRGEKVQSTAPDYCSYRPDADNSTITAERLCAAVERQLEAAALVGRREA